MKLELEQYPDIQKVLLSLVLVELFFFVIDLFFYTFISSDKSQIIDLFDITLEGNLPTWFSSTQALMVAVTAYLIATKKGIIEKSTRPYGWIIVALFFLYLAIDDTAQIHERVSTALEIAASNSEQPTLLSTVVNHFPSYYWQIVFVPLFALIGGYILNLMYREFGKSLPLYFFICGGFFYVVAVLLDYIEGSNDSYLLIQEVSYFSAKDIVHILRALEEVIEMFGTSLILVAFLVYLQDLTGLIRELPLSMKKEGEN